MGICGSANNNGDSQRSGRSKTSTPAPTARLDSLVQSKQRLQELSQRKQSYEDNFYKNKPLWEEGSSSEEISKVYRFEGLLGESLSGIVRKASLLSDPSKQFAVKTIYQDKLTKKLWEAVSFEIEVLRESDSPFLATFFECYKNQTEFNVVLEWCQGGDLVQLLERKNRLEEHEVKKILWEAATAINYLHHFGIVHRDIKLDNLLLTNKDLRFAQIKLIDFGLAKDFSKGQLNSVVGTPYYVAPEVFSGVYTCACDIWSLGVVLYMLLTGKPLFSGKNNQEIYQNLMNRTLDFEKDKKLSARSSHVKALLASMLVRNPSNRASFHDIFNSKWFNETIETQLGLWKSETSKALLFRLLTPRRMSPFQQEILKLMIKMNPDHPLLVLLRGHFALFDSLNNGIITPEELHLAFSQHRIQLTKEEVQKTVEGLKWKAEGVITYTEFVIATVDDAFISDERILQEVFKRIDLDNTGFICFQDISACFERFGYKLGATAISQFIEEFDLSKDKLIDFQDFRGSMRLRD